MEEQKKDEEEGSWETLRRIAGLIQQDPAGGKVEKRSSV
jgi:hypothetical protein